MNHEYGPCAEVGILGWSCRAFLRQELDHLRTSLRLPNGQALPHAFVRHAEDQTIAALAVILQVLDNLPQPVPQAEHWGVLAAPEFFGREATLAALKRYSQEGPSAISPHLIPNHCLHSLAGSLSVLLGCHGPNYGLAGSPGQFGELLLAGLCEILQTSVPGYWLVATGWRRAPCELGAVSEKEFVCLALALAICQASLAHGTSWAILHWQPWPAPFEPELTTLDNVSLESFIRGLYHLHPQNHLSDQPLVKRWYGPQIGILELRRCAISPAEAINAAQRGVAA